MKIKRFLAASLHEAKQQIVRELGEDAIVLSSRKVKRHGLLGWLGFSQVEVTAAIDVAQELVKSPATPSAQMVKPVAEVAPWQELQADLAETKKMLATMAKRLPQDDSQSFYPGELGEFYLRLVETGIDQEFLLEFMDELSAMLTPTELESLPHVERVGRDLLVDKLRPLIKEKEFTSKHCVCLIGPTGVGKTTTIAKLAAAAALRMGQDVALVTFDTYRIAAVDQLRTYGEILDAPVEVVLTPGDMRQALDKLQAYDVVFVDSVGRSQQNKMQLSELKAFLDAVNADAVYLTLSATTQIEVMQEIVQNYRIAKPTALIFTKLDEAYRFGPLLNLALKTDLPIAYLANGQGVPDDLLQPTPQDLVGLLMGDKPA